MIRNFEVVDSVGITLDDRYFDLHNAHHLSSIRVLYPEAVLELAFMPPEDLNIEVIEGTLLITFSSVTALFLSAHIVRLESREIQEVGFKNPEDFDHDWLNPESYATAESHLFVRLAYDEFIRVGAEKAHAVFLPR